MRSTFSKHVFSVALLPAILLGACSSAPSVPPALTSAPATIERPATSAPAGDAATVTPEPPAAIARPPASAGSAAVTAMVAALARQIGVTASEVKLVTGEAVDWPDACLGVALPGEACAQAVEPGYRMTFDVRGQTYVLHTDAEGRHYRVAASPVAIIGETVMQWVGMAEDGSCREAVVGAQGIAAGRCSGRLLGGKFAAEERQAELTDLARTYGSFTAETPAGRLEFTGYGTSQATPAEQRMLAEWARLVQAEAATGAPGAAVLAWHREGGVAGFCDDLSVNMAGAAEAGSCRGGNAKTLGRGRLNAEELAQLYTWIDGLGKFEHEAKDPGTADAMTVRIQFDGTGSAQPNEGDRTAMNTLAGQVFARVSK